MRLHFKIKREKVYSWVVERKPDIYEVLDLVQNKDKSSDEGLAKHPRALNKGNGLRVDAGDLWVLTACAMQPGGTGDSS